jgi:hypothetical protein
MNRIILTDADVKYLFAWRDEHNDLIHRLPRPMDKLRIELKDPKLVIVGSRKDDRLMLHLYHAGRPIGDLEFILLYEGKAKVTKVTTKTLTQDDISSVLSLWCSLMAIFVYGDVDRKEDDQEEQTEQKERKKSKSAQKKPYKKASDHVTYILLKAPKSHTSSHKGSHAKKTGCFSVRGHFRHYKSGKVVWIAEFKKGTGKEKERTYKLGAERKN